MVCVFKQKTSQVLLQTSILMHNFHSVEACGGGGGGGGGGNFKSKKENVNKLVFKFKNVESCSLVVVVSM